MTSDKKDDCNVVATKRLMGALLRMPPKPHSAMKLGKDSSKPKSRLLKDDYPNASKRGNNRRNRTNDRDR